MSSENPKKDAPKDASGHPVAESSPTTSDAAYPKRRGPGEFGTHGGATKREEHDPKVPGVQEK